MVRLLYCLLIFVLGPVCVSAQKFQFHHLGTEDGLIQSDINHITQDKKGNIWIGTNAGLSVYDGKKFLNYDDLRVLSSLKINNILCDHKGVIWVATDNGLLKYDKKFTLAFKSSHPVNTRIFQLAVDKDNNKYFISNRDIFKISANSDSILKWPINIPSRSPISVISVDAQNNFWVGTLNAEAYKITREKTVRLKVPFFKGPFHGTSPLSFFSVKHTGSNFTFFVSSKGLFIVEKDTLIHVGSKYSGIPDRSRTLDAAKTSETSLWVGSDSGVFKVSDDGRLQQMTKINAFTNNSVTSVFEDAEKNLWFGTYGDGIFRLSTESVSLYDQVGNVDLTNIESITKTDKGDVILGSYNQGIIRMTGNQFTKNPFSARPVFFRYVTGLAAKGNHMVVGTFGQGMFEYNIRSATMIRSGLPVPELFVNAILPYQHGFLVFAGGRILYSFDNDSKLIAKKEMPNLSSLFAITDSTLIFIENGKIDIYDAGLNLLRKDIFTEITSRISCLEFYENYIVAGTIGEGLFLYDKDYRFIRKLLSRSNIIYSLKISGNHLFVGSNVGLSKFSMTGFPAVKNSDEKVIFNGECKEEGYTNL